MIDIGANLTHSSFRHDVSQVIDDAVAVGVNTMIVTGASDEGNRDAQQLLIQHAEHLYATAGVHPHHAGEYTDESDAMIRELVEGNKVVAVGEAHPAWLRVFKSAR